MAESRQHLVPAVRRLAILLEVGGRPCLVAEPSQAALEGSKDPTSTAALALASTHRVPPLGSDPPQRSVGAFSMFGEGRRTKVRPYTAAPGPRSGAVLSGHKLGAWAKDVATVRRGERGTAFLGEFVGVCSHH